MGAGPPGSFKGLKNPHKTVAHSAAMREAAKECRVMAAAGWGPIEAIVEDKIQAAQANQKEVRDDHFF